MMMDARIRAGVERVASGVPVPSFDEVRASQSRRTARVRMFAGVALCATAVVIAFGAARVIGNHSPTSPTPIADSPTPPVSAGNVSVSVVETCGAGGEHCPEGFISVLGRYSQELRDGVLFATPTVAYWGGIGCGAGLLAPFGRATVTPEAILLREKWVNTGPTCSGSVFAFIRFTEPVFDMHSSVEIRIADLPRDRMLTGHAVPAPDLAPWVGRLTPTTDKP